MKIKIICVGTLSKPYFKEAVSLYLKRMSYVEILEVKEVPVMNESSFSLIEQTLNEEAESILRYITPQDYVVALAIDGNSLESMVPLKDKPYCFIIGGSYGLGDKIYKRANARMSISQLTFPHQMMRLVLLDFIEESYK